MASITNTTPPPTWHETFALLHRLWGAHASARVYDPSAKRRWSRLLELLETFADRDGYRRPPP